MVDHTKDSEWENVHLQPPGNPYASLSAQGEDDNNLHQEPTDAEKRAYVRNLQNPPAHIEIFGDLDSEVITEEWLLMILSSYLPKSPQASDRKAVNQIASDFVGKTNVLTLKQKGFVKQRLLSMAPEGGRLLDVARTTLDSIKIKLQKILDEAQKK
jgi:hypothetical protein